MITLLQVSWIVCHIYLFIEMHPPLVEIIQYEKEYRYTGFPKKEASDHFIAVLTNERYLCDDV